MTKIDEPEEEKPSGVEGRNHEQIATPEAAGHFSRFKALRRANFISALRDEWERR
jgi:hypothetical protein